MDRTLYFCLFILNKLLNLFKLFSKTLYLYILSTSLQLGEQKFPKDDVGVVSKRSWR